MRLPRLSTRKVSKYGSQGKPFNSYAVSSLVQRYGLPTRTDIAMANKSGWLTANVKRAELGISKSAFYRMRSSGKLICKESSYRGQTHLYKSEDAVMA